MAHSSRRSYHTDFIAAAQAGLLAPSFRRTIPKSTLAGFRRRDLSSVTGLEHAQVFALIRELHSLHDLRRTTALLTAVVRVSHLVKSLGLPFQAIPRTKFPEVRRKVVALVRRLSDKIPRDKLLSLLGLSPARFTSWSRERTACLSSPLSLCRRSVPHQLTKTEVRAIKREFSSLAYLSWPAVSIAWKLVHSGLVAANVATVLRYARIMGLDAIRKIKCKSRKRGSFAAERPNQAWHMDVTTVTTADNRKAYVQLVVDNYSRKILAWKATLSVSGLSSSLLLTSAFASLTRIPEEDIALIVDGGPENNNRHVEAWLSGVPVKKLIAQVDVSFSNSLIEAVNKVLKYRYLFRKHLRDFGHLLEVFPADVADYNERPHYALKGLSPDEAYAGKVFDRETYERGLREAREIRLRENRAKRHPCRAWALEPEREVSEAGGE